MLAGGLWAAWISAVAVGADPVELAAKTERRRRAAADVPLDDGPDPVEDTPVGG